jgi:hypothetical protein
MNLVLKVRKFTICGCPQSPYDPDRGRVGDASGPMFHGALRYRSILERHLIRSDLQDAISQWQDMSMLSVATTSSQVQSITCVSQNRRFRSSRVEIVLLG